MQTNVHCFMLFNTIFIVLNNIKQFTFVCIRYIEFQSIWQEQSQPNLRYDPDISLH
jgi:hypothetical protein